MYETIREALSASNKKFGGSLALSMIGGESFTFNQLYNQVINRAKKLKALGISKGDKVALLSSNSPYWGISYLAITFTGAIVVPVLNDFSKKEIFNVLEHSGAKALFISNNLLSKIENCKVSTLKFIIAVEDFTMITPKSFKHDAQLPEQDNSFEEIFSDDLAAIIYTSGTTGSSKGVMLSHRNILSNIHNTYQVQDMHSGDRLISVLPLSHTYECTLGFLMPVCYGASVYYLQGPPTVSILLPALKLVKPTMMLVVPLLIEKIYKLNVLVKFSKGFVKYLYTKAPARKLLHILAGKKLMRTFGGKVRFFGIGGSKLDPATEKFLQEARFPYAIGYGLTETSPLIAAAVPGKTKHQSTGFEIPNQELRLHNVNEATGEGEIITRGENVMKGYYKNQELTESCFTSDGWFRTGDLGIFDKEKRLYIKGRLKNMILSATGENIYPEEIEAVLGRHQLVVESIVYEHKGKLVAKVHLDYNEIEKRYAGFKETARHLQSDMQEYVRNTLDEIRLFVNSEVSGFSKLSLLIEQSVPFEKTPTLKIKKYLYI